MIKCYSELCQLESFEDRFEYLAKGLSGKVGTDTFGFDRYLNQMFYNSVEWKKLRNHLILRDNGCDLGVPGHDIIGSKIIIHHMNPIGKDDIINQTDYLMNPEYLICVSAKTHNAIHFGGFNTLPKTYKERSANDTCPWKH